MENENLIFYNVSDDYIEFLRKFDDKVLFNKPDARTRPYVGFVLKVNNLDYLVPLSSQIRKSNEVTTVIPNTFTESQRLKNESDKRFPDKIAVIKFNNMIPVLSEVITKIDLDKLSGNKEDEDYKNLLLKEMLFCSKNKERIIAKAHKTNKIFKEKKVYMKEIIESCCDFMLLEQKCKEYAVLKQLSDAVHTAASTSEEN